MRSPAPSAPARYAGIEGFIKDRAEYDAMYARSVADPDGFWGDLAEGFTWKRKWEAKHVAANIDVRAGRVDVEWFKGGVTNLCFNCLDRCVVL